MSRLARTEDEDKLVKFYKQAYGEKHILNDPLYHNWQFRDNPFNKLDTKSIIIVENKGEIYAHLGLFPVELKVSDYIRNATWFIPYFVLEKYRVFGLGFRVMDFAKNLFDFTMALNVSNDSRKIFAKNNWTNFGNINRFIAILDKKRIEKFFGKSISESQVKIKQGFEFTFERVHSLDESYDGFWQEVSPRFPITINRKREYLNWRYLNHPLTDYHFLTLHDKEKLVGYSVLRFEDKNEILKAARIVDLVVMYDYETSLLQNIIKYSHGKVDFVDFFLTGNFYEKSLCSTGFFNNKIERVSLPTVFNPIDPNRKSTMEFLYKQNDKGPTINELNDINNWYIVKGDSDQDRAY